MPVEGVLAPAGLYSNVRDGTYDPNSHLHYHVVAGIASGSDELPDPSMIRDWYPWPVYDKAPRPLRLAPTEPLSQRYPDTRWAVSLGSGTTREWATGDINAVKHSNHFWGTFAKNICLQFSEDRLEYFVIYEVNVNNVPRVKPLRPAVKILWQHACIDVVHFNCTAGAEDYNCPWDPINTKVFTLLDAEYPPSRAELTLRPKLQPGARVRFKTDLLTFDGKIRPGQTGTFNESNDGTPPVGVIWDEWTGPVTVDRRYSGLYFVFWEQLELIDNVDGPSDLRLG